MIQLSFFSSDAYTFIIIPLLIFIARICDVSLGTIRIIFISKGMKYVSSFIGFCEILIWLLAIGQIMQNLTNIACYVAYAGGFAAGTFVGIYIEERLAVGTLLVKVILRKDASGLIDFLKFEGYGVTSVVAEGSTGPVHIIYVIVRRIDIQDVIQNIEKLHPKAFYTVMNLKSVSKEVLPLNKGKESHYMGNYLSLLKLRRKGK